VPARALSESRAANGQAYDGMHPESAMLVKGGLVVAYGRTNGDLPERVATLSLLHIASVEDVAERGSGGRRGR